MSARIRIGPHTATIDGYRWSSPDPATERLLNAHLHPQGPSGADPNPDATMAQRMAERYGGTIERSDEASFDPDVIY